MAKKVEKPIGEEIGLDKVRKMVRDEIIKRYGGVREFLRTEQGEKFGGMKIRPYLYDKGAVNFEVLSGLCKYLGIGELSRKIVVSRSYFYRLSTSVPNDKKTS